RRPDRRQRMEREPRRPGRCARRAGGKERSEKSGDRAAVLRRAERGRNGRGAARLAADGDARLELGARVALSRNREGPAVMTTDRWQQISALYHEALARPRDERPAYLRDACGGDESLHGEVEALLAADGEAALVDTPALEAAARALADERG